MFFHWVEWNCKLDYISLLYFEFQYLYLVYNYFSFDINTVKATKQKDLEQN